MSAASFKDIGNKALQAGNFDEAIKAYSDAIAIDPNDHVFYSNRSAAYLSKGDAENALADGMKCIEINPSWPKGYTRKGAALHALKRYDEAKNVYEQGLQIAPTDSGLKSGLAEVQKIIDSRSNPGMGGGLFGPQLLSKLVGHPKFGPKLADKAFMAKLQMLNTNPQLLMQDPELMEVLQVVLGGPSDEMQTDDYEAPPQPAPQPKKTAPPPEPEVPLSEEEKAVKAQKDRAGIHSSI
jgi:stress-induced-phosphoprotein 1